MKSSKFTDELIAFVLRQAETGTKVAEVCCKMGISEATFGEYLMGGLADYEWKSCCMQPYFVLEKQQQGLKIGSKMKRSTEDQIYLIRP